MEIGERVKQRRLQEGLSVDDLAKALGKNRATIYRYESSEIENLPVSILLPLANALNTTPTYLMGWDNDDANADEEFACLMGRLTASDNVELKALIADLLQLDDADIAIIKTLVSRMISESAHKQKVPR